MATAFSCYVLNLAVTRKSRDLCGIHRSLRRIGDVFLTWGDEDTALSLFEKALDGFTMMDIHRGRADCMVRIGDISAKRGNASRARDLWSDARSLYQRSSSPLEQISECEWQRPVSTVISSRSLCIVNNLHAKNSGILA